MKWNRMKIVLICFFLIVLLFTAVRNELSVLSVFLFLHTYHLCLAVSPSHNSYGCFQLSPSLLCKTGNPSCKVILPMVNLAYTHMMTIKQWHSWKQYWNYHRMIHRKKDVIMTVEELKRIVESRKNWCATISVNVQFAIPDNNTPLMNRIRASVIHSPDHVINAAR